MSLSSTPNDPLANVPSDRLWLRSELMGTQVITRDSGRRLGVVGEVVVDIDRREVVALGLRDNPLTRFLPGLPRWMPLDRIRQVGDVILVDSADSLSEGFSADRYSRIINCQVITESGQQLGRVLGFSFDIETGELTTLVMGALGVPLLGEGVLSTWEIPVDEIVSSGADRIIVYEGAEDKLKQLNSGFLEKLGVGGASWEEQERERYRLNVVPVENQLSSGQPAETAPRQLEASQSERFEAEQPELEYVELEQPRGQEMRRRRYLDELSIDEPEPYREPERYSRREPELDDRRYRTQDQDERAYREPEPSRYANPISERDPSGYGERPRYDERPRPASRRPVERPGAPLDVEPMEMQSIERQPLDLEPKAREPWNNEPPEQASGEPVEDPW
ncbi:PRC-barrel domain-containing protein [Synechococcus sp. MIT S9220]|uniref:PRC-barrel domain-containing protein n=1 Tax=unclassified Synechococcus TaxID=2626047 RepID=UPI00164CBA1E|nr:PRC-barrel domain-containing protein [Synechococcus sp. MIT S9220]NOL46021.1 photosystem reaction center subunit H [Synechococcus sp. MIT S9220]QNJ23936.1 PRC-barrel domain-containing protein [Synechococcus sp. MIT S9220]